MKILMVCLGNICRSPLAEGILAHKSEQHGLAWEIDSAATLTYHIGQPPYPNSIKVAKDNGIDISHQRARLIQEDDFSYYDKIYAMSADVIDLIHRRFPHIKPKVSLILEESDEFTDKEVPDPYYGTHQDFVKVYQMLDKVCDHIIQKYK